MMIGPGSERIHSLCSWLYHQTYAFTINTNTYEMLQKQLVQLDDNRWMNASAHCSASPDCTLDLHNRAGDIQRKAHIITLSGS